MQSKLLEILKRRGYSATDLSKATGVSLSKISLALRGIPALPTGKMSTLKEALVVDPEEGLELNKLADLNGEEK